MSERSVIRRIPSQNKMHSSMRYSDRTISYDTGLNLMQPVQKINDEDELGLVILPPSGAPSSEKRRRARKTGKEHSFPVIFASQ